MIQKHAYLAVVLLIGLFILGCQKADVTPTSLSFELQNQKEHPNDLFSFQRTYPFQKLNIEAYEAGLKDALQVKMQKTSSPGFGEPWITQGPGNAGGRVNAIEVHPTDEDIIYLGFATSGVFKTTDGGNNWNPIFDDQPFLSIGDITLDPNDSETIYVGTGDPNITGFPAIGNGIYKSIDGGVTWTHLGLTDQRVISRIIVDPTDSNTIYVSCMGLPFERNDDRGLYKSTDGGANWEQVLFVSNQSGVIDLVMNPDNPMVLYAASWDRIRNNEESIVSGPNAKIHKTTDGGTTWTVLDNGLPSGNQGRIGLAIFQSDPDILVTVYVGTDSNMEGIYRTEDAGTTWTEVPTSVQNGLGNGVLGGFGWYFGQIRLHPTNDQWIYLLGVASWFTSSNGTAWTSGINGSTVVPHVDFHEQVFNFQNDILVGNDGGANKKESTSLTFADIENIPANQVYRTAYDPHHPDIYYGGLQDNGSQTGNANNIANWDRVLGGDGFQMAFHPTDSNIVFAETQFGNIFRSTNGLSGFVSSTSGINANDRRSWDMPYFISSHEGNRMYAGTDKVYKSETTGSPFWSAISPDLTDGNVFGSPFHTITTVYESPLVEGLLYVGTTDANVWRSNDDGTTWDSLHMDLPERYVTSVKASPDIADNVYVSISGLRYNEFLPRIFKSTDRGDNWTSINGDMPDLPVNDIFVLPGQDDQIIFAATDGGIYATSNGGVNWEILGIDLPMVTTYDLELNEANNYLIAATFGRSIVSYPIDSILNNLGNGTTVSGQILNMNGVGVDSVDVVISGDLNQTSETDVDGNYLVSNLSGADNCTVRPSKDINIRNGVSTFDILQMQKHIVFIDTLDSPYKILAGDVNQSNTMSIFDILIIRKVLLFDQDTFSNTGSWKFIPEDYVFSNPINPFLDDFPEEITCADIQNGASPNFVGFKMGDVSGNASPGLFDGEVDDRNEETLYFSMDDILLNTGETYQIPIRINTSENLSGFQLALNFKESVVFEKIETAGLSDLNQSHFFYNENARQLRFSWSNPNAISLKENDILFYLTIKALTNDELSENVMLLKESLYPEAYNKNMDLFDLDILFEKVDIQSNAALTVAPNPFNLETNISFDQAISGRTMLSIFDATGKKVFTLEKELPQGNHSFTVNADHIPTKGIYFYQLKTPASAHTGKLLRK